MNVLDNLSLNIPTGQFVSVLGPSGCGKSTLLKVVAGILPATSGSVTVSGREVQGPVPDVGMVFQSDLLMPWRTVLENVLLQAEVRRLPQAEARQRAMSLLDLVGLSEFTDAYPRELSGGMRQRASIARGLLHDPPLLLMDEPFGALDALTRDQMGLDLVALQRETSKTVLFVTHSIDEAIFVSDRVLVFSNRPTRVVLDLEIDLAGRRNLAVKDDALFRRYARRVREEFEHMGLLRDPAGVAK